jgi:hypothetical protein
MPTTWRRRAGAVACAGLAVAAVAVAPAAGSAGRPVPDQASPAGASQQDGSAGGGHGGGLAVGDANGGRHVGTVNPLDVRNPFCDERLAGAERRNCRVTGTPEGRYPTSNYGFDIHIDTGLDNIVGNFQALLAHIANAIWQACLFVLNLVLTLLGWAFGLTPFSDGETMREIDHGLGRFYAAFTEPWMAVAIACVGVFGLYRGLVRREASASIAGTIASVALMVLALWILHEPRDTVGVASDYANDAALAVLAAPQGGLSDPRATYAEATAEVWNDMTIPGFAALDFSSAEWALSKPDPELLKTANEHACFDAAYLALIPPRRWQQLTEAADAGDVDCSDVASLVPAPRTNAEIYLRSSPGSEARDALWDSHTDDAPYSSYFAIQGDGGAWTRLPLVVLIALGLLGGICLLAWLALRIFVQTAVAFVLVLMTPVAFFLPAFGERGRAAFALWGGTLAGALVAKLVYAGLLSVCLFATTVVASLVDDVGAMVAFLVMAGIWWAVFLKREALISFMSVSDGEPGHGGLGVRGALGLYAASELGQRLVAPVTGRRDGRPGGVAALRGDRAEATRRVAAEQLDSRAAGRLDGRLEAERRVVGEQEQRQQELAAAGRDHAEALAAAERHQRTASLLPPGPERERHEAAREAARERAAGLEKRQATRRRKLAAAAPRARQAQKFVAAAEERERESGTRWSAQELSAARERIRSEVDRPASDPVHAWRAGISAERYAALQGDERDRTQAEVGAQLRQDRAAFGAIPDRPSGLIDGRLGRLRYRGALHRQPGGARGGLRIDAGSVDEPAPLRSPDRVRAGGRRRGGRLGLLPPRPRRGSPEARRRIRRPARRDRGGRAKAGPGRRARRGASRAPRCLPSRGPEARFGPRAEATRHRADRGGGSARRTCRAAVLRRVRRYELGRIGRPTTTALRATSTRALARELLAAPPRVAPARASQRPAWLRSVQFVARGVDPGRRRVVSGEIVGDAVRRGGRSPFALRVRRARGGWRVAAIGG